MRKLPLIVLTLAGLAMLGAAVRDPGPGNQEGVARTIVSLMSGMTGEAIAQQLQFREVPPESAKRIVRSRRRAAAAPEAPAAPATSAEPEAPATPDAPESPEAPGVIRSQTGDIVRIGHDVKVGADEVVDGDLVVIGARVEVEGHVEGDVVAIGGNVHLLPSARVDGDVACIGGRLTQEEGATVGGQRFTASGFGEGRRSRREVTEAVAHHARDATSKFINLLMLLGVAWAFAALAPGRTQSSLDTLKRQPAAALGVGAMVFALLIPSLVALVLIIALLCITIIGIPVALAALFGYFLFLALIFVWGFAVVSSWLGEWVLSRRNAQAQGAAGVVVTAAEPTLVRKAVLGALMLGGAGFLAYLLRSSPPLSGIGTLMGVLSGVAFVVGVTFGAGAWLRNEFTSGLLGRVWRGRSRPNGSAPPPMSPPPGAAPGGDPPPAPSGSGSPEMGGERLSPPA